MKHMYDIYLGDSKFGNKPLLIQSSMEKKMVVLT